MNSKYAKQLNVRTALVLSLSLFTSLVSLLSSNALLANGLSDNWYVGGAFGKSYLTPDGHGEWETRDKKDVAKKIYAGFDISPSVGLEGFWTSFGSAAVKHGTINDDIKYSATGINAIYHPKLRLRKIKPFAKLGAAKLTTQAKRVAPVNQLNDYAIIGGVGVDYDLTQNWAMRTEYEYFDQDISHLSLGLKWKPGTALSQHNNQHSIPSSKRQNTSIPAALPLGMNNQSVAKAVTGRPYYMPKNSARYNKKTHYRTIRWALKGGSSFAIGSSQLTPDGRASLSNLIADIQRSSLQVGGITIVGYTDNVGSYSSNQRLSAQRAKSVANYLAKRGIPWRMIKSLGRGKANPIASNTTSWGRAKNRRVEITVQGVEKVALR